MRDCGSAFTIRGATSSFSSTMFHSNQVAIDSQSPLLIESCGFFNHSERAVISSSSKRSFIIDSTFEHNLGGGIIVTNGQISADNISMIGNGITTVDGGAILLSRTSGSVYINNSFFEGNTGGRGGSISTVTMSSYSVTITNTIFLKNSARSGGAIFVQLPLEVLQCLFENNTASDGGAIARITKASLSNSSFIGNKANTGGAISVESSSDMDSCIFLHNVASSYGGSIYILPLANVTAHHSRFEGNFASAGGSIASSSGNIFLFENHYFNNTATSTTEGGGSLYAKGSVVKLANSKMGGNTAVGNGGSCYTVESVVIFYNNTLVNNHAQHGGAMYFMRNLNTTVEGCEFNINSANIGGAIWVSKNHPSVSSKNASICIY